MIQVVGSKVQLEDFAITYWSSVHKMLDCPKTLRHFESSPKVLLKY
jgi:hypothetical protein